MGAAKLRLGGGAALEDEPSGDNSWCKPGGCFMCGQLGCDCPCDCPDCCTETQGSGPSAPFKFCIMGFSYNPQLNGTYMQHGPPVNGSPAYKLQDVEGDIWCCLDRNDQWNMQTSEDKGEASGKGIGLGRRRRRGRLGPMSRDYCHVDTKRCSAPELEDLLMIHSLFHWSALRLLHSHLVHFGSSSMQ